MLDMSSFAEVIYHTIRHIFLPFGTCQLVIFIWEQHTKNNHSTQSSICLSPCLSQHLIVLHLKTFAPADFPLQSVLVESPTNVDQQSSGTGVDSTAENHVTHVLGHMDAKPQDHTHQQAFRVEERREGVKAKQLAMDL